MLTLKAESAAAGRLPAVNMAPASFTRVSVALTTSWWRQTYFTAFKLSLLCFLYPLPKFGFKTRRLRYLVIKSRGKHQMMSVYVTGF